MKDQTTFFLLLICSVGFRFCLDWKDAFESFIQILFCFLFTLSYNNFCSFLFSFQISMNFVGFACVRLFSFLLGFLCKSLFSFRWRVYVFIHFFFFLFSPGYFFKKFCLSLSFFLFPPLPKYPLIKHSLYIWYNIFYYSYVIFQWFISKDYFVCLYVHNYICFNMTSLYLLSNSNLSSITNIPHGLLSIKSNQL